MESNSVFVQPVLLKKLDERMRTHFLDSFKPFSTLARRLSPTLTEYSSYQTGQRILLNPRAIGCAMSFLSLQSCEMKAKGFSYRERSRALVGVRKTTSNPCSLVRCSNFPTCSASSGNSDAVRSGNSGGLVPPLSDRKSPYAPGR